jgi:Na+-transporting methylmalonyl-CoA/oxaloacetate decarboxylase gamma subunit
VLAVLWILAALCYFLAPVLQRFASTRAETSDRVLAELDGVQLVATRAPVGIEAPLERGEHLVLRRRS